MTLLPLATHGHPNATTLYVPVTVLDTRTNCGTVDSLVSPVGGSGTAWVRSNRLIASTEIPDAEPGELSDADTPA